MFAAGLLLLQSAFAALPPASQAELERCGVDEAALNEYLALEQNDFDQDFKGGWRGVSYRDGCSMAAAELIKAYILYSVPTEPKNLSLLRWHAGQALATDGFEADALPFFRGAYHQSIKIGEPDPWNLYVDATIAFLENDREGLVKARDRLAAVPVTDEEKAAKQKFLDDNPEIFMPEDFVDDPGNLSVVKGLLACFGQSYREAYTGGCLESDER